MRSFVLLSTVLLAATFTHPIAAAQGAASQAQPSDKAQAAGPSQAAGDAQPANQKSPTDQNPQAAPTTDQIARRAPRFVPILVSATDGSGNPVNGLTKEQLTILDNHQLVQALQLYKGSELPLHLGIVLLASQGTFSQQQEAAINLAQKVLRPNIDEGFVISARGKKAWASARLDWVHEPNEMAAAIRALDPNAGLPDPFSFSLSTDEVGLGRMTLQTLGGNGVTVFDIVATMMNSDPRPSRRVVVMFRDPWAHSPGFGNRANTAVEGQLQRVIAAAQQMHVTTFAIGLEDPKFNRINDTTIGKTYISNNGGGAGGSADYDVRIREDQIRGYEAGKTNIQRLASDTGGETFWSVKKNYSDAVSSLANELAGQYMVTFTPSDAPSSLHTLKITCGAVARLSAQSAFFYGSR
jgi:VWFA-related protein